MAKRVVVSSAQKSAARAMVNRSAVTGRYVSDSVRKIAHARVEAVSESENSRVSKLR
jgi:hypothetical protein